MRYVFITVLLWTSSINLFGQSVPEVGVKLNSWRTMVGYSLYGGGDISGFTIMNEYNRYIGSNWRIAPNVKFSSANRTTASNNGFNGQEPSFTILQANIFEIGSMVYLENNSNRKTRVEIGSGLFYRNFQWTVATGPNTGYGNSFINLNENSMAQYGENTVGFNLTAGLFMRLTKSLDFNLNALLQSDTGGNTGYGLFTGLTVRF